MQPHNLPSLYIISLHFGEMFFILVSHKPPENTVVDIGSDTGSKTRDRLHAQWNKRLHTPSYIFVQLLQDSEA